MGGASHRLWASRIFALVSLRLPHVVLVVAPLLCGCAGGRPVTEPPVVVMTPPVQRAEPSLDGTPASPLKSGHVTAPDAPPAFRPLRISSCTEEEGGESDWDRAVKEDPPRVADTTPTTAAGSTNQVRSCPASRARSSPRSTTASGPTGDRSSSRRTGSRRATAGLDMRSGWRRRCAPRHTRPPARCGLRIGEAGHRRSLQPPGSGRAPWLTPSAPSSAAVWSRGARPGPGPPGWRRPRGRPGAPAPWPDRSAFRPASA